jgi:hypothetical protein
MPNLSVNFTENYKRKVDAKAKRKVEVRMQRKMEAERAKEIDALLKLKLKPSLKSRLMTVVLRLLLKDQTRLSVIVVTIILSLTQVNWTTFQSTPLVSGVNR